MDGQTSPGLTGSVSVARRDGSYLGQHAPPMVPDLSAVFAGVTPPWMQPQNQQHIQSIHQYAQNGFPHASQGGHLNGGQHQMYQSPQQQAQNGNGPQRQGKSHKSPDLYCSPGRRRRQRQPV